MSAASSVGMSGTTCPAKYPASRVINASAVVPPSASFCKLTSGMKHVPRGFVLRGAASAGVLVAETVDHEIPDGFELLDHGFFCLSPQKPLIANREIRQEDNGDLVLTPHGQCRVMNEVIPKHNP